MINERKKLRFLAIFFVIANIIGAFVLPLTTGAMIWVLLGVFCFSWLIVLSHIFRHFTLIFHFGASFLSLSVIVMASFLSLALSEFILSVFTRPVESQTNFFSKEVSRNNYVFLDEFLPILDEVNRVIKVRGKPQIMPGDWEMTTVETNRAKYAYMWHNVLHEFDNENMRMTLPILPKHSQRKRVVIFGDSLTYGAGIETKHRFSNFIDEVFGEKLGIEIVNMGTSGFQSTDVLMRMAKFLPVLEADLVIYAVCLNDFLPSGRGEYNNIFRFSIPMPDALKNLLREKTLLFSFMSDKYNKALYKLRLRNDFFDDILKGFDGYQIRFASDVSKMNQLAKRHTDTPLLGLVVDQYPYIGGRGEKITKIAEEKLRAAGANIVKTDDYYKTFHGKAMNVSDWEGHPNEFANLVWADMLTRALLKELQ